MHIIRKRTVEPHFVPSSYLQLATSCAFLRIASELNGVSDVCSLRSLSSDGGEDGGP